MSDEMRDEGLQPATKADLSAFATKVDLSAFATKEDLKGFATKEDLKGFATKEDLKGFATKEDLKAFATKADFVEFRGELRVMFRPILATLANHTTELADIRGKMVTRDEFHSRMDAFAGRVDDFDYSSAKHRSRLDDHEKRIGALEEKRA